MNTPARARGADRRSRNRDAEPLGQRPGSFPTGQHPIYPPGPAAEAVRCGMPLPEPQPRARLGLRRPLVRSAAPVDAGQPHQSQAARPPRPRLGTDPVRHPAVAALHPPPRDDAPQSQRRPRVLTDVAATASTAQGKGEVARTSPGDRPPSGEAAPECALRLPPARPGGRVCPVFRGSGTPPAATRIPPGRWREQGDRNVHLGPG